MPGGDLDYYKLGYNAETYMPLTRHLTLKLRTNLGYANSYRSDRDLPFFEHYYAGGFGSVRGFERNSLGPRTSVAAQGFTAEYAWDDSDGDGLPQQSEMASTFVLCEDPDEFNPDMFRCQPGQLITQRMASTEQLMRRDSRYSAFGGNILVEAGAEVLFPLPFIEDQRAMQSSFFIEGGNVFSDNCREEQLNCYGPNLERISVSAGVGLTWITGFGPLTFSVSRPLNENEGDDPKVFDFTVGGAF